MASRAGVRIIGIDRLRRKLGALEAAEIAVVKRELVAAALNVQAGAKRRAPVDTGRLRNSITYEIGDDGTVVRVGTNTQYAPYLEFGTRKMPARPFLFPAFEEEVPKFKDRLKRALDAAARRVAAST